MMDDNDFDAFDDDMLDDDETLDGLAKRFEENAHQKHKDFFDFEDLCDLIDYYISNKDLNNANAALRDAKNLESDNIDLKISEARILLMEGQHNKALNILDYMEENIKADENITEYVDLGDVFFEKALNFSLLGDTKSAMQHFEQYVDFCTATEMLDETNYKELSTAYDALGQTKKAMEICFTALEDDSGFLDPLQLAFRCQDAEDDEILDLAIEKFQKVAEEEAFNDLLWRALAVCYESKKMYEKSNEVLDYAVAIENNSFFAYIQKSINYMQLNDFAHAIDFLDKAQCLADADKELKSAFQNVLYSHYSEIYQQMENYDVAINYLKKILDSDKKRVDVWRELTFLYEKKENFNAAFSTIADAVKENPDDVFLRMSMIAFCLKNNKDDMAVGILSQLFPEINEKNAATLLFFISDYYEINAKILEYLLYLIKKCPYRDVGLLIMSVLAYKNGDMEQSRELLANAVAANPVVLLFVVENNLLFLFEKVPDTAGIMLELNTVKQQILLKNIVNQYFDE
ncbi:hypothetical protein FACS1894178_0620 [Bacteroidia bacterium]|nr:hypothetical protein FACS1894178_0620 [Bacteroidia bacterium]